jgi:hypothetical protein
MSSVLRSKDSSHCTREFIFLAPDFGKRSGVKSRLTLQMIKWAASVAFCTAAVAYGYSSGISARGPAQAPALRLTICSTSESLHPGQRPITVSPRGKTALSRHGNKRGAECWLGLRASSDVLPGLAIEAIPTPEIITGFHRAQQLQGGRAPPSLALTSRT